MTDFDSNRGFSVGIRDRTALLSFDRPQTRNPLSVSVLKAIGVDFERLESSEDIFSVVFTGSGNVFASGANLNEVSRLDRETAYEFGKLGQSLMRKIAGSRLNTIAAVNGFCMGGALDLALACRKRIASPNAVFAHPGVSLGIITGWGGTQMLPKLIGMKNAYDMFLSAKRVDTEEALRIGLIDRIAEDPVSAALELCGNE